MSMRLEALPRIGWQGGVSHLEYFRRARSWVRQSLCALHGHDLMLHFEPGRRLCLRCANCGHETPGWQMK